MACSNIIEIATLCRNMGGVKRAPVHVTAELIYIPFHTGDYNSDLVSFFKQQRCVVNIT